MEHLLDQGCTLDPKEEEEERAYSGNATPSGRAESQRSGGREVSWDSVQLRDLPALVTRACGRECQFGSPDSVREATAGMLRVLHAICVAGECAEVQLSFLDIKQHLLAAVLGKYLLGMPCYCPAASEPVDVACPWKVWQGGRRCMHGAGSIHCMQKADLRWQVRQNTC